MGQTFREQIAGFPVRQMLVVSLIRFSEPLAFTSLFPYLYFMIRDFQIAPTEQEISKYSGYLASLFAFFQFLFAVHWGKMLNRIGRKPVLLCGLLGTLASLLLFGFSTNYYMALFARSVAGMLNGNIAVLRTVIGEICVERRHQALGFSTLPLLFNFGAVLGPLIGGSRYLTAPKKNSPYDHADAAPEVDVAALGSALASFRARHPYALSNIVVLMFLWFSFIMGFLFLEETNDKFRARPDYGLDLGDRLLQCVFGGQRRQRPWHRVDAEAQPAVEEAPASEATPLLPKSAPLAEHAVLLPEVSPKSSPVLAPDDSPKLSPAETSPKSFAALAETSPDAPHEPTSPVSRSSSCLEDVGEDDLEAMPFVSKSMSNAIVRRYSLASELAKREPAALTPRVVTVIVSNCIISLHSIAYNEFLPVFLAARFQKDALHFPLRIVGGFGMELSYIGTLFSSTGIMGMLIVLFIFPWIDRRLGTLQGFRLSLCFFPVVYACVPLSIFTLRKYNAALPAWLTPVLLYSLTSLKTLASATGMPQVMLLNHRAAAKQHRAYVNSLTMSMLALARCIGPIVFGYLMTLGDRHHVAWLSWWLMALMALFGLLQSFVMQDYNDD